MFGLSDGHLQRVASVVDRSLCKYTHMLLLLVYGVLLDVWINNTGVPKKNAFYFLGKLKVTYIDLTLLNPNMATKMLYHPPHLREKGLMSKTMFLI